APDPARAPRSLDDVVATLRRDRLDDFAAAFEFAAAHRAEPGALALAAQLQLTWGEDQLIVAEILGHEARGSSDRARAELAGVGDALAQEGSAHVAEGMLLARELITAAPNDYHGWRAAADYYRLTGDWPRFDQAIARLDTLDPRSNGYSFLRGMEQLARYHHRARAQHFFCEALARDPKLARAEVQLMLGRASIGTEYADYLRLKAISPEHQVVLWLGPLIERQHAEQVAEESRHESSQEDRALDLVRAP